MDAFEIVVLAAATALVVFTVVFNLVRRRRGKSSGCGGCCEGCTRCPRGEEGDDKR